MARKRRINAGGVVYHVLNRANAKRKIFEDEYDFLIFRELLHKTSAEFNVDVLAYCIMPSHWHLLVRPRYDNDLSKFMKKLTEQHVRKYHSVHGSTGTGHLYQDRFKSFVADNDEYVLQLCYYIERNPLRAGLVLKAEDWNWSSMQERTGKSQTHQRILSELPIDLPKDYVQIVNNINNGV